MRSTADRSTCEKMIRFSSGDTVKPGSPGGGRLSTSATFVTLWVPKVDGWPRAGFINVIDSAFQQGPITPMLRCRQRKDSDFIAAARWHSPDTGLIVFHVVQELAVGRFKNRISAMLSDLRRLYSGLRSSPNLRDAATIR
jgi:hypothetical protein